MRRRWRVGVAAAGLLLALPLHADDETDEYVAALQGAGLGDFAVDYLQAKLDEKPPDATAADYELQLAMAFAENAGRLGDLAAREQALRDAKARFEDFAKRRPNHARAGEAMSARAGVDLQSARLRAAQAALPSYAPQAAEFANEARAAFQAAVGAYDRAAKAIAKQLNVMPIAVDDDPTSKALRRERSRVFSAQIQAEFQAAYAMVLGKTDCDEAPWYVVPADRRWYRNWAVARLLADTLTEVARPYPHSALDADRLSANLEAPN